MSQIRNILVVDDEQAIHHIANRLLDSSLYSVDCATNAKDALNFLSMKKYNLVFCDVDLPGMKGYDLLRHRRENGDKFTPFVFITGHGSVEGEQLAHKYGAADYICKPFGFLQFPITAARYSRPFPHQVPKTKRQKVLLVNHNENSFEKSLADKLNNPVDAFSATLGAARESLETTYYDIVILAGHQSKQDQQLIHDFHKIRPNTKFIVYSENITVSDLNIFGEGVIPLNQNSKDSLDKLAQIINDQVVLREQNAGSNIANRIPSWSVGVGPRGSGKTFLCDLAAPAFEFMSRQFDAYTTRIFRDDEEYKRSKRRFVLQSKIREFKLQSNLNEAYTFMGEEYVLPVADACAHMLLTRESISTITTPYETVSKLREKMVGAGQRYPVKFMPIFANPQLIIERLSKRPGFDKRECDMINTEYFLYANDMAFSSQERFFNTSFRTEFHSAQSDTQPSQAVTDFHFERSIGYQSARVVVDMLKSLQNEFP